MTKKPATAKTGPIRVAIYCRQSVTDVNEEFGSIAAQREQIEMYIQSQRARGWEIIPGMYNDANATGANLDRPAFQRLVNDIKAGKVDCVAVFKIDRLSRSLLDFTQTLRFFDESGVSFISTTQQFDTGTSVGRLVVNILATFAQFERETIAERTKSKMLATRKRGMWTGGWSPNGYDNIAGKLVVNSAEAQQVREIFELYLSLGSLTLTLDELAKRGWKTKEFTNREGTLVRGVAFTKHTLRTILVNPAYVGKIRFGDELTKGQHEAILDEVTFQAVQELLKSRHRGPTGNAKKTWNVLLAGIVRCARCNHAYGHASVKSHGRVHHYYVCQSLQKRGAKACRGSRVSMRDLDQFVFNKLCERDALGGMTREQLGALEVADKARLLQLLVEEIRVDAAAGDVQITFCDDDKRRESA